MPCVYVFKKGKHKGEVCGKEICGLHNKSLPMTDHNSVRSLDELPPDVLKIVVDNIVSSVHKANVASSYDNIKGIIRLLSTSVYMHSFITDDLWIKIWHSFEVNTKTICDLGRKCTPKERVLLFAYTGCQFCKRPRIRKVYEQFAVRCCTDCLHERTISDYRLRTLYLVEMSELANLPYTTHDMYNHHIGTYTLRFYWKDDVERLLGLELDAYLRIKEEQIRVKREEENAQSRAKNQENLKRGLIDCAFDMEFVLKYTTFKRDNETCPQGVSVKSIIQKAEECWDMKTIDNHIKKYKRDLSMMDIRATKVYKSIAKERHIVVSNIPEYFERNSIFKCILTEMFENELAKQLRMHMKDRSSYDYSHIVSGLSVDSPFEDWDTLIGQFETIVPLSNRKIYKCDICSDSNRLFCRQGLYQHKLSKHHVKSNSHSFSL